MISDGVPSAQRVAYGTADGRVHIRALQTGADVGPAGGTLVADGAFTNPGATFGGLVSGGGTLYAVHHDGAGVEIARFDEATGTRVGGDVALPDSLGCSVAGAPLLTPVSPADGSRLLVFTIAGSGCGSALVRMAVNGPQMGAPVRTAVAGVVAGVAPVQVVLGNPPRFTFAVARTNGLQLIDFDGSPAGSVELPETPAAVVAPETAPSATPNVIVAGTEHVFRLDQGPDGALRATATVTARGTALAIGGTSEPRVAVAGGAGLTVLGRDLAPIGSAPGAFTGLAASGDLAFAIRGDRLVAVDLNSLAVTDLGPGAAAPALARGFVVTGPAALLTRDVTPPTAAQPPGARGLSALAVVAGDDRGVAAVEFRLGGRLLAQADAPVAGTPFAPGARYEVSYVPSTVPPGRFVLDAIVRDAAGNTAHAERAVTVTCEHRRRGSQRADRIHGGPGRDCLTGRRGRDRLDSRGGGADALSCGPGRDTVRADAFDRVSGDCERVRRRRPS